MCNSIRKQIVERLNNAYQDEYKDAIETYRDIERKAIAMTTISGVFLAGVFAFVREVSSNLFLVTEVLLIVTLVLILATILFCLAAVFVFTYKMPPWGTEVSVLANDILKSTENADLNERYIRLIGDQNSSWEICVNEIHIKNEKKGRFLFFAQITLALSSISILQTTFYLF